MIKQSKLAMKNTLSPEQVDALAVILKKRFENNMNRHEGLDWELIWAKALKNPERLWSLDKMEQTGGEPDVVGFDKETSQYIFCDCASESPKGRRSVCYDRQALEARKEHKPKHSAVGMAEEMGIALLTESEYLQLQELGTFDIKTSSWLNTPLAIRELGGAIFGDKRFGRTFVYHNGAESYYAARGFRGILKI